MIIMPEYRPIDDLLRIETSKGDEFSLPFRWSLEGEHTLEMRGKVEDRALSHGSTETGDFKAKHRTLELAFYVKARSRREFDSALDEVKKYFVQANYKLFAGRTDQYFRISRLVKVGHNYVSGFKGEFAEITIGLRCADPFRYSDQPTEYSFRIEEPVGPEGLNLEIDNESNADVPLVIAFRPLDTMSDISLASIERKESFIVQDTMLTGDSVLTVNGENATVYRDGDNAINTFSGTFISLDAGLNTLRYQGSPGTITVTFFPRWW